MIFFIHLEIVDARAVAALVRGITSRAECLTSASWPPDHFQTCLNVRELSDWNRDVWGWTRRFVDPSEIDQSGAKENHRWRKTKMAKPWGIWTIEKEDKLAELCSSSKLFAMPVFLGLRKPLLLQREQFLLLTPCFWAGISCDCFGNRFTYHCFSVLFRKTRLWCVHGHSVFRPSEVTNTFIYIKSRI